MSQSLELRDPQVLDQMQGALSRFSKGVDTSLRAAEMEFQRTRDWLIRRVAHCRREVEKAKRDKESAEAALRRCEASGYTDRDGRYHPPNCSGEERDLEQAVRSLRSCQEKLKAAQVWQRRMDQAEVEFRSEARSLQSLGEGFTSKAAARLKKLAAKYERIHQGSSIGGLAAGTTASIDSLRRSAVRKARRQEMRLVRETGRGTRNWTRRQLGQLARGKWISGYEGHHMRDVSSHSKKWTGDPRNIKFLTQREHFLEHGGSFHNPTTGKLIDRMAVIRKNRFEMRGR